MVKARFALGVLQGLLLEIALHGQKLKAILAIEE